MQIYMKNKPHPPLGAVVFDVSWRLEQSWQEVTKATFLPSYIELGPTVSYEKIFEVFCIGKISPAP